MDKSSERYVFLQVCIRNFNSAWRIVSALEEREEWGVLSAAAFRMAIIEYAKPFGRTDGVDISRHKSPERPDDFSAADESLHKMILELRNQVFAHSDISKMNAELVRSKADGSRPPLLVSDIRRTPRLREVRLLIEKWLAHLYALAEQQSSPAVPRPD